MTDQPLCQTVAPAQPTPRSPLTLRTTPQAAASTAHNAEWMKGVEREIMELKQEDAARRSCAR